MNINGSLASHQTTNFRPSSQTLAESTETETAPPADTFTFSNTGLSGKEKLQVGTIAVGATLIGAVPVLGMLSNGASAICNGSKNDELGTIIGVGGAVSNLAATIAADQGHAWALAIPAVLGGISWAGYAHSQALNQ